MTEKSPEQKECCEAGKIWKDGKCVMPEVTFIAFIMSLNTAALFHLGEIADPATGQKQKDPVLAKNAIDSLRLLQAKTTGNLTDEEKNVLESILYDLKMRYIKIFG
ncbi:MAG: DUF1844 domain-containing protein [Proteobacteria bacterium]|nr:DUF1844 domain-containing protein [Pseudomonadota bacterium]MBU1708922.1 DUF1844 domain-containing protein [Pseudomonadota bacterium]